MAPKLEETSEIWGSSESDHKMAVFLEGMSRDQLTTLMMETAGLSETLIQVYVCTLVLVYSCTSVHGISYQEI